MDGVVWNGMEWNGYGNGLFAQLDFFVMHLPATHSPWLPCLKSLSLVCLATVGSAIGSQSGESWFHLSMDG